MNFDISKVFADMLSAVTGTVGENCEEIKTVTKQFLQQNKERLELIAELRITGELPQDKFESRLNDQKLILEAQFQAITVISKAIAQKAANAAIDVFTKAVKAAVSAIL